jgi:uncharacterized protein YggL (DUF469 family)
VRGGEVLDRVASILGIERTELDDAFEQAKSEIKDEKQAEALAALVENDTLTEAEAAAIGEWLESRPAAMDDIKPDIRNVFKFHNGRFDGSRSGSVLDIPSISSEHLARMVEAGKLSQEDVDAIQAWLDARPDAVDKLVPKPMRPLERYAPFGEGTAPFGGGGFFQFDGDGEGLDLDEFREQLEQFRSELPGWEDGAPGFDGEFPVFPGFEVPEGGFFHFDGDGFEFEFKGDGPEFFFRGGRGDDGRRFRGFGGSGGPGGFGRFHDFTPRTPEPTGNTEPAIF